VLRLPRSTQGNDIGVRFTVDSRIANSPESLHPWPDMELTCPLEHSPWRVAGVTTTWLRGAGDPRLPPNPRLLDLVQTAIDHIYIEFIIKAAAVRNSTLEKISQVARGRVWTGPQVKARAG